jgi:glyoxylate/hydroxypyruvate/2-ketogluconate reductase
MKPRILVTRENFPEVLARLAERFDVEDNQGDTPFTPAAPRERLADKDGAPIIGVDRIDGELLDDCPRLKAVCGRPRNPLNPEVWARRRR